MFFSFYCIPLMASLAKSCTSSLPLRSSDFAQRLVYAVFCGTQWIKIWESEVQRVNRICCVMCPERSFADRECNGFGAKQRSHFLSLLFFCREIFCIIFKNLIFFVSIFPRGVGGEFHFLKHLIITNQN